VRRRRFAPLRVGGYAGSMAALFAVDRGSGEIRTAAVIDREAICDPRQTTPCVVRVDVAVQPPEYFQIIRAQVQLDDLKLNSITRTRTRTYLRRNGPARTQRSFAAKKSVSVSV